VGVREFLQLSLAQIGPDPGIRRFVDCVIGSLSLPEHLFAVFAECSVGLT